MKFFVLFLLVLIQGLLGQNACNFQSGNYNLNWNLDTNNDVNFNLNYNGFPQDGSSWIAFGYWQNKVILVNTVNGQVQVSTADILNNQPTKTVGSNVLSAQSGFLSNGNLQAQFTIPYAAFSAASGGQSCMNWQFYTSPTQNGTNYNGSPQSQQVCNIQSCNQDGRQLDQSSGVTASPYGQSFSSSPSPYYNQGYQSQYNQGYQSQYSQGYQQQYGQGYQQQYNPSSQYNQNQQFNNPGYSNQYNQNTGFASPQYSQQNFQQYDPSNPNIQYFPYTYNQGFSGNYDGNQLRPQYDAPTQSTSNSQFVIENPNYQFLSPQLNQVYKDSNRAQSGNRNGVLYDQNGLTVTTTTEAPVLTNEQQNQANYQRILQNPPTTVNPGLYTNNIYGYDYRSNQNMPYTLNGNPQQYQPPNVRKFEPSPSSPFRRRKRQANSPSASSFNGGSLTGTAYEGQDTQFIRNDNYGAFFDSINPVYNTATQPTPTQQYNPNTNYNNNFNTNTNSNYNSNYNYNNNYNTSPNFNNPLYDSSTNTGYRTNPYYNSNLMPQFDANNPIYYPYITPVTNPNSPNYQNVLQQDAAALNAYQDPSCTGTDPYWCQNYVQNFMLWQNQYESSTSRPNQAQAALQPSQSSCSALTDSLRNAYHRCCQTVRAVGCQ